MTLRAKFESALSRNPHNGCLEWQRALNSGGYGQLYSGANDRPVLAHRVAWEQANGPIPKGMFVCHKCDNPKCCDPEHLFLGTLADNNRDAWRKGRMTVPSCQRHEGHWNAKLTKEQVACIREESKSLSQRQLAKKYGLSQAGIGAAIRGATWAEGERRKPVKRRPKVAANFDANYEKTENGCWLWTAAKTNGYGCLSIAGKTRYAHRFAYERHHLTQVPETMFLQHTCSSKLCVNPEHLRLLPKAGVR